MTLEQYVSIAEILGVIAIFVTLIFLTVQIQQYTRATRAATIQSALHAELDVAAMFLANAGTWDKVITGAAIGEGEELRLAIGLYNVFMIDTENRYLQYRSGYLAESAWQGRLSTLPAVIGLPIFPKWRPTVGARSRSVDFLELIDELASKHCAQTES